jgi:hypothetical protein
MKFSNKILYCLEKCQCWRVPDSDSECGTTGQCQTVIDSDRQCRTVLALVGQRWTVLAYVGQC